MHNYIAARINNLNEITGTEESNHGSDDLAILLTYFYGQCLDSSLGCSNNTSTFLGGKSVKWKINLRLLVIKVTKCVKILWMAQNQWQPYNMYT